MTAPVSTSYNPNAPQQPIGAFGLGGSKNKFEPGNFVVNPPPTVYKYSIYDELALGEDRFKEILGSLNSKSASKNLKKTRRQRIVSKIINWSIAIGAGILAYKYRADLKNIALNLLDAAKKAFTKKN